MLLVCFWGINKNKDVAVSPSRTLLIFGHVLDIFLTPSLDVFICSVCSL